MINIGNKALSDIFLGNKSFEKAYLGNKTIFTSELAIHDGSSIPNFIAYAYNDDRDEVALLSIKNAANRIYTLYIYKEGKGIINTQDLTLFSGYIQGSGLGTFDTPSWYLSYDEYKDKLFCDICYGNGKYVISANDFLKIKENNSNINTYKVYVVDATSFTVSESTGVAPTLSDVKTAHFYSKILFDKTNGGRFFSVPVGNTGFEGKSAAVVLAAVRQLNKIYSSSDGLSWSEHAALMENTCCPAFSGVYLTSVKVCNGKMFASFRTENEVRFHVYGLYEDEYKYMVTMQPDQANYDDVYSRYAAFGNLCFANDRYRFMLYQSSYSENYLDLPEDDEDVIDRRQIKSQNYIGTFNSDCSDVSFSKIGGSEYIEKTVVTNWDDLDTQVMIESVLKNDGAGYMENKQYTSLMLNGKYTIFMMSAGLDENSKLIMWTLEHDGSFKKTILYAFRHKNVSNIFKVAKTSEVSAIIYVEYHDGTTEKLILK